jgi:formylglycine-generating enzyme required for sulfatase activity
MGEKEKEHGEIARREEHRIERRGRDGLLSRGLADLQRRQSRTIRREFEFSTVELDEYGDEIEWRTGRAIEIVQKLLDGIELEMVEIPAGSFWMGSTEDEVNEAYNDAVIRIDEEYSTIEDWYDWETPRHLVTVKSFLIGKFPVTQAQWSAVMGDLSDMDITLIGDNRPIVNVSWEDAVHFCNNLTNLTGNQYRLPSEAEWEYAARAETKTPYAFGKNISTEFVNFDGNYPYGEASEGIYRHRTVDVGSLDVANNFGLFDMHGNVWEWCQDHWHGNYNGAPNNGSAWIDSDPASYRVGRGGSWGDSAVYCRSAIRLRGAPGNRYDILGFRLARTLP